MEWYQGLICFVVVTITITGCIVKVIKTVRGDYKKKNYDIEDDETFTTGFIVGLIAMGLGIGLIALLNYSGLL